MSSHQLSPAPEIATANSPMTTKHLYDTTDGLVLKALRGFVAMSPGVCLHEGSKTVFLPPSSHRPEQRVAVIAGGGAGHEPAHAGYVGSGMLSAAVCGEVFASPSAKQIGCAIALASAGERCGDGEETSAQDLKTGRDVLVVINNYTGDRLNFGLAIEKARVLLAPLRIDSVVVADDVSRLPLFLPTSEPNNTTEPLVGARGLAANILVCKLLGALAFAGTPLSVVKSFGDAVVAHLATVGVGLEHCHIPGHNIPSGGNGLGAKECEVGLGLHNEAGMKRRALDRVETLVDEMVGMILGSTEGGFVRARKSEEAEEEKDEVVLFVNNLGGMSQLEMGALVDDVPTRLARSRIYPRRIYSSSYMTSLNAPGFSISLLNVSAVQKTYHTQIHNNTRVASEFARYPLIDLYDLLDAPTDAPLWLGVRAHWPSTPTPVDFKADIADRILGSLQPTQLANVEPEERRRRSGDGITKAALRGACKNVLAVETELTAFDTIVGDGDCGATFARGAKALLKALDENQITLDSEGLGDTVQEIADLLEDSMCGTIGALFAIFLTALSSSLRTVSPTQGSTNAIETWSTALSQALSALSAYTPARPGDRTIVDAIYPFVNALSASASSTGSTSSVQEVLVHSVAQAREGAERTRGMKARLGRAAYLSGTDASRGGGGQELWPPDPGAWGVAAILEGLVDGLRGRLEQDGGGDAVGPKVSN
ncbi:unnamed protein product [Cyclocybe aegerita]|uniref:Dihydroxyacetone kinase n=1 Tax=Cyclocybe aegerita TaxID=1973307 RepID=A0A8S0W3P7_CYCAE|nr:unnamed protein product [Cyclocybe aegerita]